MRESKERESEREREKYEKKEGKFGWKMEEAVKSENKKSLCCINHFEKNHLCFVHVYVFIFNVFVAQKLLTINLSIDIYESEFIKWAVHSLCIFI